MQRAKLFLLLAVLLCVPGPAELLTEAVSFMTGVECCEGECDDGAGECPASCLHCPGCCHPSVLPGTSVVVVPREHSERIAVAVPASGVARSGYPALLFRPPEVV